MYDHVWGNVCHVNTYEREFDEGIWRLMGEFDNLRTHLREHTRTYTRECDYVCFFLVFFCRKFDNLIIHFRDICTWYSHMYKKLVYLYLKKEKEENRFNESPWYVINAMNPSQRTHTCVPWDVLWNRESISGNTHIKIHQGTGSVRCLDMQSMRWIHLREHTYAHIQDIYWFLEMHDSWYVYGIRRCIP